MTGPSGVSYGHVQSSQHPNSQHHNSLQNPHHHLVRFLGPVQAHNNPNNPNNPNKPPPGLSQPQSQTQPQTQTQSAGAGDGSGNGGIPPGFNDPHHPHGHPPHHPHGHVHAGHPNRLHHPNHPNHPHSVPSQAALHPSQLQAPVANRSRPGSNRGSRRASRDQGQEGGIGEIRSGNGNGAGVNILESFQMSNYPNNPSFQQVSQHQNNPNNSSHVRKEANDPPNGFRGHGTGSAGPVNLTEAFQALGIHLPGNPIPQRQNEVGSENKPNHPNNPRNNPNEPQNNPNHVNKQHGQRVGNGNLNINQNNQSILNLHKQQLLNPNNPNNPNNPDSLPRQPQHRVLKRAGNNPPNNSHSSSRTTPQKGHNNPNNLSNQGSAKKKPSNHGE